MVDSHAHLGLCEPGDEALLTEMRVAGVKRVLDIGLDEASNRDVIARASANAEVFAAVGRHPNSAGGFDQAAADDIAALAEHERVRAIGETGLDYYRDSAPRDDQAEAFVAQIGIARSLGLPLVVHLRDSAQPSSPDPERAAEPSAVDDAFAILDREAEGVTVILHCFSAPHRVRDAGKRGWLCSFAGNLTYPRSAELREASRLVPDELLLVETDSPFLAPQPIRGKPNSPAHVVDTAAALARERGCGFEVLERLVEENSARVFGW